MESVHCFLSDLECRFQRYISVLDFCVFLFWFGIKRDHVLAIVIRKIKMSQDWLRGVFVISFNISKMFAKRSLSFCPVSPMWIFLYSVQVIQQMTFAVSYFETPPLWVLLSKLEMKGQVLVVSAPIIPTSSLEFRALLCRKSLSFFGYSVSFRFIL